MDVESLRVCPRRPSSQQQHSQGWHNGFASMVSVSNPTIWHFLYCLKIEQGLAKWKIIKKQMKEPSAPWEKRWIEYDTRLHALIDNYEDKEDKMTFLKQVGTMLYVWDFLLDCLCQIYQI